MRSSRAIAFCCAVAVAAISDPAAASRKITVTTSITDAGGMPLENVPIQHVSMVGVAFGLTGPDGTVVLTVDAEDSGVLVSRLWDGTWHTLEPAELDFAESRYEALRVQHSFRALYRTALTPDQHAYTVNIVASPTVTISGRLVDPAGAPIEGGLGAKGFLSFDFVVEEDDGAFVLRGVKQGSPAFLVLQSAESPQVRFMTLVETQTQADLDLGDVVLPGEASGEPVGVTATNDDEFFDAWLAPLFTAVSFIRVDGTAIYHYPLDRDGAAVRERLVVPPEPPLLPPGDYYIAPGIAGSRPSIAVYLAVRSGRQAVLDAAGVPKLTVVPGATLPLSFDARACYDAIIQAAGDLID